MPPGAGVEVLGPRRGPGWGALRRLAPQPKATSGNTRSVNKHRQQETDLWPHGIQRSAALLPEKVEDCFKTPRMGSAENGPDPVLLAKLVITVDPSSSQSSGHKMLTVGLHHQWDLGVRTMNCSLERYSLRRVNLAVAGNYPSNPKAHT